MAPQEVNLVALIYPKPEKADEVSHTMNTSSSTIAN